MNKSPEEESFYSTSDKNIMSRLSSTQLTLNASQVDVNHQVGALAALLMFKHPADTVNLFKAADSQLHNNMMSLRTRNRLTTQNKTAQIRSDGVCYSCLLHGRAEELNHLHSLTTVEIKFLCAV